jgi:D-alanine-D-alanine ligase
MSADGKLSIGVIFGGRSGEHEVSLASARSVLAALDPAKYTLVQIGITRSGVWVTGKDVLELLSQELLTGLTPCTLLPDPTRTGLYGLPANAEEEGLRHLASLDVIFPVLHGTFGEDGTLQGLLELAGAAYVSVWLSGACLAAGAQIRSAVEFGGAGRPTG